MAQMSKNLQEMKRFTSNLSAISKNISPSYDHFNFYIEEAQKHMTDKDFIAAEIFATKAYNSIKDNDRKDQIGKATSLLAIAKLAIINSGLDHTHYGSRREELIHFLKVGAEAGDKDSQALLALFASPADSQDFSYVDDEAVRADLERHAENPNYGFEIEIRLVFEFYIKTNPKKAHKILDRLLASDDSAYQTLGSIGKLIIADFYSQNFTQIKPLLDQARAKYLDNGGPIPVPVKYDFAVLLDKYDKNEFKLVNEMLEELVLLHFLPAIYFTEERNQKLGLRQLEKPEEEFSKEEVPETKEASETDKSAEKKVSRALPPKASSVPAVVNPIIATMNTAHMVLTKTAKKDLNKLIKSNGGQLPFDTEIPDIAEKIITSKGQCSPTLAKKIRGTETFWRSWIGRDYRMDWQYEKQSDGSMKIKIRHIRPKKNFTYGF